MDAPLNDAEKKILLSDAQTDKVPHYLISQITTKMKNENLIRSPKALIPQSVPGILALILFSVGLLAAGYVAGKTGVTSPPETSSIVAENLATTHAGKSQYILFVHNDDIAPADPMQQVQEYGAWLQHIKGERIAGGEHLHDQGWVIRKGGDKEFEVASQDQFTGRNEIGGYFKFEARDAKEAVAIASTCPHLNYHGTLELREIYQH